MWEAQGEDGEDCSIAAPHATMEAARRFEGEKGAIVFRLADSQGLEINIICRRRSERVQRLIINPF